MKGKTNNPNGRPVGSQNKVTKEVRAAYDKLVQNNIPSLALWLKKVGQTDPARAVELILKLSEFVLPKLQSVAIQNEFETLPDEQLNYLLSELLKQSQNEQSRKIEQKTENRSIDKV
jgi:hypothetical protein